MEHRLAIKVRFGELDPYNHVNHAVYVAWFEAGRGEALESIGMSLQHMAALGFQVVVTELTVRYRQPATAGDAVEVQTWVSEIGGARSTWNQRLIRTEPDGSSTVLCEAEVKAGATDAHGRPTRMPPELRAALQRLAPADALSHPPS